MRNLIIKAIHSFHLVALSTLIMISASHAENCCQNITAPLDPSSQLQAGCSSGNAVTPTDCSAVGGNFSANASCMRPGPDLMEPLADDICVSGVLIDGLLSDDGVFIDVPLATSSGTLTLNPDAGVTLQAGLNCETLVDNILTEVGLPTGLNPFDPSGFADIEAQQPGLGNSLVQLCDELINPMQFDTNGLPMPMPIPLPTDPLASLMTLPPPLLPELPDELPPVPIELVALSLRSATPINIDVPLGSGEFITQPMNFEQRVSTNIAVDPDNPQPQFLITDMTKYELLREDLSIPFEDWQIRLWTWMYYIVWIPPVYEEVIVQVHKDVPRFERRTQLVSPGFWTIISIHTHPVFRLADHDPTPDGIIDLLGELEITGSFASSVTEPVAVPVLPLFGWIVSGVSITLIAISATRRRRTTK